MRYAVKKMTLLLPRTIHLLVQNRKPLGGKNEQMKTPRNFHLAASLLGNESIPQALFPLFLFGRNRGFYAFFRGIDFHFPHPCKKAHLGTSLLIGKKAAEAPAALISARGVNPVPEIAGSYCIIFAS